VERLSTSERELHPWRIAAVEDGGESKEEKGKNECSKEAVFIYYFVWGLSGAHSHSTIDVVVLA